ncbi:D-lyxose/D-mannose family sugar isomerase [Pedobacter sp. MC2016-24]|uniref:D-lyxose/D-mannose family sugar isomerase n=1 Tax=Pedobacter sp. MC2016-24 TaxID=2780090 RepID=UPI00187FE44D|nr:D-lyxose/D-mannose family sugar isomerase [Pedobacter sp. MC2016-24]MBE9600276.1 D-lyxose/D-mannose family sugar isomerase [Pedobacter sp. MC2016-24]
MKRSTINQTISDARNFFEQNGWALPPAPRWDVTDFGLGDFSTCGLVLVNLAEETEYCEKLMYATKGQLTPAHTHLKKKEDIICRNGVLVLQLWTNDPAKPDTNRQLQVKVNGQYRMHHSGALLVLQAGERVTIESGVWHAFFPDTAACIIGEVSTANDDLNDNYFSNPEIGRFSHIDEDVAADVKLLSDQ